MSSLILGFSLHVHISQLSRYIPDRQTINRDSIPGRGNFFKASTPALGLTLSHIQWAPENISSGLEQEGREAKTGHGQHSSRFVVRVVLLVTLLFCC
jgi:hypothetical protein